MGNHTRKIPQEATRDEDPEDSEIFEPDYESKRALRPVLTWEIEEISRDPSYHGPIKGLEAEERLGRAGVDCYLTRYSETRSKQERRSVYVISVVHDMHGEWKFGHFDLSIEKEHLTGRTVYEILGAERKMYHIRDLLKSYKNTAIDHQFSGIGECLKTDGTIFHEVDTIAEEAATPTPDTRTCEKLMFQEHTKPTLELLTNMGIIKEVSAKWYDLGLRLGEKPNSLDNYESRAMKDNSRCCVWVFDHWINNGGNPPYYPLTWKGLYDVLTAIDCGGTAQDMEKRLHASHGIETFRYTVATTLC